MLWSFQSSANNTQKPVKISWEALSNALQAAGEPGIDLSAFSKMYDQEAPDGILHNLVNQGRDSYSENGLVLYPDNAPKNLSNTQEIDPEHSTVKSTAMHALKSKK